MYWNLGGPGGPIWTARKIDPWTVQAVACRCTDCVIPGPLPDNMCYSCRLIRVTPSKLTIITVQCMNQNMKSFFLNTFKMTRARKFIRGLRAVGDISNQFNRTNKQALNLVVWFQANKRNCWSVYNVNAGVNLDRQQTQWCNGHHPAMRTQRLQEWTLETRYKYMGTRLRETSMFQRPLIVPFNAGHTVELVNFLKGKELHPKAA